MKRLLCILIVAALFILCLASAEASPLPQTPLSFMQMLYRGEFQAVFEQSTPDMQAALGSADGFAATWAQLEQSFGAFEEIVSDTAKEQAGMTVGSVVCAYQLVDVTFNVAVTADGLLAGLTVAAAKPKAAESTADQTQFVSEPITLRAGEADETQGMLTLPNGEGPFPVVLMMQGSGPSDMNETAYGLTPFRDIAEGLAQTGIASIRYDKYSFAHADLMQADPALINSFTIEQEYITDARDALALLQADERIGDIYLLGHSQGAMLVPRVMQELGAESFQGGIMLAGSPLPLWELQYHQNLALFSQLTPEDRAAAQEALDAETAKLSSMLTLSDDELKAMTFFGISAYYQKDEMSFDAAQTAIVLQKPLFIAQGGKDWQVTPADGIELWRAVLADQNFAQYKEYPDMNHMLCDMAGDAAGDASDYQAGETVSKTLIDDIAAWVLN